VEKKNRSRPRRTNEEPAAIVKNQTQKPAAANRREICSRENRGGSQQPRAAGSPRSVARRACGGRDVGKRKEPEDAIVRTHGEPRQRRGIQLTDGDVASGEDETREPRCASGEHNQRTDSANGMKTRDASGDALREKMLRRSTARNPRLTAARLLRARPLGTAQP
jgi:hypothetical protein